MNHAYVWQQNTTVPMTKYNSCCLIRSTVEICYEKMHNLMVVMLFYSLSNIVVRIIYMWTNSVERFIINLSNKYNDSFSLFLCHYSCVLS